MRKIRILSVEEIKKIAAGEVVERPANIVKELLENALDAGATKIDIYIEDGGKKLVRVIDNGCGMSAEDVQSAFEQHATSKIRSVDDLQQLQTFGFRGEALSSISSVSTIKIQTKEKDAESGTALTIRHAQSNETCEVGCPQGTDIAVHDIFSNIPARKKFLKATETEWRQILLLFQSSVLAHQSCHFKLFHEGRLVHNCPVVSDLSSRVIQFWNQGVADHMLKLSAQDSSIDFTVNGLISDHQYMRYNTAQIFLFVNNRWIKNYSIIKALIKGYSGVFPHGKYPAGYLFMRIDPTLIDVNIHPRKEEVQFVHVRKVEQLIQHAVKRILDSHVRQQLHDAHTSQSSTYQPMSHSNQRPYSSSFSHAWPAQVGPAQVGPAQAGPVQAWPVQVGPVQVGPVSRSFSSQAAMFSPVARSIEEIQEEPIKQGNLDVLRYRLIGQYKNTYILLEKDDGLVLIDQHAAHERILYELFSKRFEDVETVSLMFPYAIELNADDLALIEKYIDLLGKHGIVADCMGENRLVIKSVPVYLRNVDLTEFIRELIGELQEGASLEKDEFFKHINEKLHAQMACKAAVKAGDELSREKMHEIIEQLEKTENKMTCPHGRPTIWLLSLSEIEKRFRRDYGR